ncbi:unnamed protein product, partial [Didymodactylos carnosus]
TVEERNLLIENVYPKLKEYCQEKYGLEFQIFLSHRYGGRFLPATITQRLFSALYPYLINLSFVEQWYKVDQNPLEAVYILQPLTEDLIKDNKIWNEIENKLHTDLRQAADKCYAKGMIEKEDRDLFFISVTEQEIHRALENNHDQTNRMLCFIREITDLNEIKNKNKFAETEDEPNRLLDKLKAQIYTQLDSQNIKTYKVAWESKEDRETYMKKFLNDFETLVKNQIDYHVQHLKQKSLLLTDLLYDEVMEHAIQCKQSVERFQERNDIMEKV